MTSLFYAHYYQQAMIRFFLLFCTVAFSFESPLYVSLGANCHPACRSRDLGLRQAAFPLDWIASVDDSAVAELIDRDFEDFTSEKYLRIGPQGNIVHTLYHFEFYNDHENAALYNEDYSLCMGGLAAIREKYGRRIDRLRKLEEFPGKVVFIRFLLPTSRYQQPHPELYWFDYRHERNEKESSLLLQGALRRRFPKVDFDLVIVSKSDENALEIFDNIFLYHLTDDTNLSCWSRIFAREPFF